MRSSPTDSLRARLRAAVAPLHDRLDAEMGSLDLTDRKQYARFLQVQYCARAPIETWARGNLAADLRPPPTAALLAADLRALGQDVPAAPAGFALPAGSDPVGLAWALAGSHLGNRAMRRRVAASLPTAFLDDGQTVVFWRGLLPRLERQSPVAEAAGAATAAEAVFRHFLAVERAARCRLAA